MTLAVDIETYSSTSIKAGVYKYVESPDFEVLLISYKSDDGPVCTIDVAVLDYEGPDIDDIAELQDLTRDLQDPAILKTAYNAKFEITALSKFLGVQLDPAQWSCTMVKAATLGFPFGLDAVAKVLGLPVQKDPAGKALLKYFAQPCKPTKVNGGRTRNRPSDDWEKWRAFRAYNVKDVEVESLVRAKIDWAPVCDFEKPMWAIDQAINSRGVMIDRQLVQNAIRLNLEYSAKLIQRAIDITGLQNPGSVAQLKGWLEDKLDEDIPNVNKATVMQLKDLVGEGPVKEVLQIRQRLSKASIKKYTAMLQGAGADDRVRGLFQYYGANRTGRWAGRQVQVQNLVKNNLEDLDLARQLVKEGDLETIEMLYGNVSRVLSQLCRTAFIPAPGKKFIPDDFSAIEARVIAWLANEKWRLDVFNTHGKIYEASGAAMFRLKMEDIKKGSVERDASKIAELALGYQGAGGAMATMIAQEKYKAIERGKKWTYEPSEDEILDVVNRWRAANPRIVKLWYDLNEAAVKVVRQRCKATVSRVTFHMEKGILFCTLPSGRRLAYPRAKLVEGKYGGDQVSYEGVIVGKTWGRIRAYGGLFAENITQAIARDLLAEKIKVLHAADYAIVMHVHDEVVIEAPEYVKVKDIDEIMGRPVDWAPGLPLKGEGFETYYYKKED